MLSAIGCAADGGGWILGWAPDSAVPNVRQDTEQAEFTYMQDCMKSTFLLSFGKRTVRIAAQARVKRAPARHPARCQVGLNYSSAAMVPVSRTARPMLSRSVTWP